tara:strand:- start:40 stop:720 length:681 start_codon:yes stop_codon:yes gene_type:complete
MKLPTAKKTKKKFYNKYIYKITLKIPGSNALRYYDFAYLLDIIKNGVKPQRSSFLDDTLQDIVDNAEDWTKLCLFLTSCDKKSFSKRLEMDCIDFYTNDLVLYNQIGENFTKYVKYRFQPKQGTEQLLLNSNRKIFVSKLPFDMYEYRVYLHPHKLNSSARTSVAEWLSKQVPNISFSESINKWIIRTDSNYGRRYIQVKDESTLLMLQLRAPDLVGKVFKYIINR